MASKKKGPAFDMNAAFSGLFSEASSNDDQTDQNEDAAPSSPSPAGPMAEAPVPSAAESSSEVVPEAEVEPTVNHRIPDDQRTRQYTITLKRGTHESLRDIAWFTRQSVSSILNNLADEYIRQHSRELEECRKIRR